MYVATIQRIEGGRQAKGHPRKMRESTGTDHCID